MNARGEAVRGLVKSQLNFTRGFAAREIPRGLRPGGNMAVPPPLASSRIPPASQSSFSYVFSVIDQLL